MRKRWKIWPWIIVLVLILLLISFLPYLFTTRSWFGIDFSTSGQVGDTIGGIMGPFIAVVASILTFAAFMIQVKANELQAEQFERQGQDQIFFRLLDTQESRIINSSFSNDKGKEVKGFQLLEHITLAAHDLVAEESLLLARRLFCDKPDSIADLYYHKMFDANNVLNSNFAEYLVDNLSDMKAKFIEKMTNYPESEKWEFLKLYFNSPGNESPAQRTALSSVGSVYFYKIEFEERYHIYRKTFEILNQSYSSFLDGFLKGWEFTAIFANESSNREMYVKYLQHQLSKHEMIIIFYYLASGYASKDLKTFVKNNLLLRTLHIYNGSFIDAPSKEELDKELEFILNS
jgi:hypothetical protein